MGRADKTALYASAVEACLHSICSLMLQKQNHLLLSDADGHATVLVPSRELAAARKAAAQRDTTSGRALTFALLLVAVAIGGLVCSRNARKGGAAAGRPTRRGPPARRRTRNEARPYDTVDHLGRPVLDGDEMESDDDWNLNPSYSDGPSRAASSTSLAT